MVNLLRHFHHFDPFSHDLPTQAPHKSRYALPPYLTKVGMQKRKKHYKMNKSHPPCVNLLQLYSRKSSIKWWKSKPSSLITAYFWQSKITKHVDITIFSHYNWWFLLLYTKSLHKITANEYCERCKKSLPLQCNLIARPLEIFKPVAHQSKNLNCYVYVRKMAVFSGRWLLSFLEVKCYTFHKHTTTHPQAHNYISTNSTTFLTIDSCAPFQM